MYVDSLVDSEVTTHELRINAPLTIHASLTAGVFMSDLELTEHNMFTYPGALVSDIGWGPNWALTDTSVTGYPSDRKLLQMLEQAGIQAEVLMMHPVIFINDVRRTDKQTGIFR